MWIDQRGSEVLTRRECRRLLALAAGGVGRLAYVADGQPVVVPVNYRMFDGDVLVRLGPGTTAEVLARGVIVAFEVDEVDTFRASAWSVLVQGLAIVLEDLGELARAEGAGVEPFVPEPGSTYVRVRTGVLAGRRFALRPETLRQAALGRATPIGELVLERPVTVGRDATIREMAARMEDAPSSFVLVGEHPGWLVTERHLLGALSSGLSADEPVEALATKAPVFATPSTTLAEAARLMADHGIRHLLVVGPDGELAGVHGLSTVLEVLLAHEPGRRGSGPSALGRRREEA